MNAHALQLVHAEGKPNIFTSKSDDYWKLVRKGIMPAFSSNNVRWVSQNCAALSHLRPSICKLPGLQRYQHALSIGCKCASVCHPCSIYEGSVCYIQWHGLIRSEQHQKHQLAFSSEMAAKV